MGLVVGCAHEEVTNYESWHVISIVMRRRVVTCNEAITIKNVAREKTAVIGLAGSSADPSSAVHFI